MHRKNTRIIPRIPVSQVAAFLAMLTAATALLVGLSWLGSPAQASQGEARPGQAYPAGQAATWPGQAGQAMVQAARNLKH